MLKETEGFPHRLQEAPGSVQLTTEAMDSRVCLLTKTDPIARTRIRMQRPQPLFPRVSLIATISLRWSIWLIRDPNAAARGSADCARRLTSAEESRAQQFFSS